MTKLTRHVVCSVCFIATASCTKNNEPAPVAANDPAATTVQQGNAAATTRSARESIAESRCQREQTCNNVGPEKKYSSTNDCLTRIRNDWKDDLNARECPGGVNQTQLNQCLAKIRTEDCGNPFDTLSRVAECTAGQICEG